MKKITKKTTKRLLTRKELDSVYSLLAKVRAKPYILSGKDLTPEAKRAMTSISKGVEKIVENIRWDSIVK